MMLLSLAVGFFFIVVVISIIHLMDKQFDTSGESNSLDWDDYEDGMCYTEGGIQLFVRPSDGLTWGVGLYEYDGPWSVEIRVEGVALELSRDFPPDFPTKELAMKAAEAEGKNSVSSYIETKIEGQPYLETKIVDRRCMKCNAVLAEHDEVCPFCLARQNESGSSTAFFGLLAVASVLILAWLFFARVNVPEGHVGVKVKKPVEKNEQGGFNGVQAKELPPGTYFLNPFLWEVHKVDVRPQKMKIGQAEITFRLKPEAAAEAVRNPRKVHRQQVRDTISKITIQNLFDNACGGCLDIEWSRWDTGKKYHEHPKGKDKP